LNVALFVTCLTDTFFPRVGEAVVRVLRHFGCTVEFPAAQTCCGQPAFNSGFHREAAVLARRMIDVFAPYECIVTPSASCAAMIQHHFAELLADDPSAHREARRLAERTFEFTTFLTQRLGVDIARRLAFRGPVTFHFPCHSRGAYGPEQLAAWCAGESPAQLRRPAHADLCCGFGGMFSIEFPEISGPMLADRLNDLAATGATTIVCNEAGCTLSLAGGAHRRGLPLRFVHVAECLAESLGLMEPAT
jgi:L-lactate dehydrogenase complex protein LldE